jgi:hypothetical protein
MSVVVEAAGRAERAPQVPQPIRTWLGAEETKNAAELPQDSGLQVESPSVRRWVRRTTTALRSLSCRFNERAALRGPFCREAKAYNCCHVDEREETGPDEGGLEKAVERAKDEERGKEEVGCAPGFDRSPASTYGSHREETNEDAKPDVAKPEEYVQVVGMPVLVSPTKVGGKLLDSVRRPEHVITVPQPRACVDVGNRVLPDVRAALKGCQTRVVPTALYGVLEHRRGLPDPDQRNPRCSGQAQRGDKHDAPLAK